jgi:hypothetical protein
MTLKSSRQIFEKLSNTKFHENPSNGGRVAPSGRTERRTHMTSLIFAFRNFANGPKSPIPSNIPPKQNMGATKVASKHAAGLIITTVHKQCIIPVYWGTSYFLEC